MIGFSLRTIAGLSERSSSSNDGGRGSLRLRNAFACLGAGFARAVSNENGFGLAQRRPASSLRPTPQWGAV